MTDRIAKSLGTIDLFANLPAHFQIQLAQFSLLRQIRSGETIFCQGEPSPYCFGIVSGQITIQRMSREKEFAPKTLSILGPGTIFGEQALFKDSPRTAMARASQNGELLAIQGGALRAWIEKDPTGGLPLITGLLQSTLNRLHQTSHELSLVYGVGRTLSSEKLFDERIRESTGFLRASLEDIDEVYLFRKNPYWNEFETVAAERDVTAPGIFVCRDPILLQAEDAQKTIIALNLQGRVAVAIVPLFDPTALEQGLQGFLWVASKTRSTFSPNILMLLNALSMPFFEALLRQRNQDDLKAQARFHQNRQSFSL